MPNTYREEVLELLRKFSSRKNGTSLEILKMCEISLKQSDLLDFVEVVTGPMRRFLQSMRETNATAITTEHVDVDLVKALNDLDADYTLMVGELTPK